MNQMTNLNDSTAGGNLSYDHTQTLLREALQPEADLARFEDLQLDREAAAAFIADQATLLSAIAHAAGLSTVKIITDLLYVNAFGDVASGDYS